jgi:hypothetical protein
MIQIGCGHQSFPSNPKIRTLKCLNPPQASGDPSTPATSLGTIFKADQSAAIVAVTAVASTNVQVQLSNITVRMEANMPPHRF